MKMIVTFRDKLGYVAVEADPCIGIDFLDGYAMFENENDSWKIPAERLVSVTMKED